MIFFDYNIAKLCYWVLITTLVLQQWYLVLCASVIKQMKVIFPLRDICFKLSFSIDFTHLPSFSLTVAYRLFANGQACLLHSPVTLFSFLQNFWVVVLQNNKSNFITRSNLQWKIRKVVMPLKFITMIRCYKIIAIASMCDPSPI